MRVASFDHVALWVSDPDAVSALLRAAVPDLREIDRTDAFTLLGADAREGKVTLFVADGPREPGVLEALTLRTGDLTATRQRLVERGAEWAGGGDAIRLRAPEGLVVELVEGEGPTDLEGVTLAAADPVAFADDLLRLGFADRGRGTLQIGGRSVRLVQRAVDPVERPLLNHLALRVASLSEVQAEIRMHGFVVEREVDAANTRAVFLRGPEGVSVEIVEHKPSFALA